MQRFIIACAQFAVTPMAVRENVEKAIAWTERAVQETGAQLVVLPETVTTGFTPDCPAEERYKIVVVGQSDEVRPQLEDVAPVTVIKPGGQVPPPQKEVVL